MVLLHSTVKIALDLAKMCYLQSILYQFCWLELFAGKNLLFNPILIILQNIK